MGEDEVNLFPGWWLAGIEDGSVVDHGTPKINHRSMLVGNVLEVFIVLRPLRSPCTFTSHIYKYTSPLSKRHLSLPQTPLFMPLSIHYSKHSPFLLPTPNCASQCSFNILTPLTFVPNPRHPRATRAFRLASSLLLFHPLFQVRLPPPKTTNSSNSDSRSRHR